MLHLMFGQRKCSLEINGASAGYSVHRDARSFSCAAEAKGPV